MRDGLGFYIRSTKLCGSKVLFQCKITPVANVADYWLVNQTLFKEWRDGRSYKWIVLLVVWAVSAFYVFGFYDRGWVPHDEGTLAQSAERVLMGELPHRDFDEVYTGGLTFLHALAFRLLGPSLISLRLVLLAFFLAFVPAFYLIALRFARPEFAALVTFLGVAWSVPNYFAGVPTWYNLFFAIFGTLALTWYVETHLVRWLFIAGLLGGLSILAKIVGLYYVAAAGLFLVFREQISASRGRGDQRVMSWAFLLLKAVGLFVFVGLVITLLKWRLGLMETFHFVLPQMAISGILLWNEWQEGHGRFSSRIKTLFGLLFPFGIGIVIPIALFLSAYLWTDSVDDLYHGMFVLPQKRLANAAAEFPPFLTVITSLPYAALVFVPFTVRSTKSSSACGLALIILLGFALYSSGTPLLYYTVWQSARSLGVIAVLAGCLLLARTRRDALTEQDQCQKLFLLLSMTALFGLVQFPFAAPVYFLYVTPLVCLALSAVVMAQENMPKPRHFVALLFYLVFAVMWTTPYVWAIGVAYVPFRAESVLNNHKGRLRVSDYDNQLYTQLVNLIQRHSNSAYIYAGPDCPQIYFLSGMRNPTRKIFDFFNDRQNAPAFVSELLEKKKVNLVVINRKPHFSGPLDPKLTKRFENRFPQFVDVGQFTVRWKD